MLNNIKVLLGINDTSKDSLLNLLITECTTFALNYCHLDDTTAVLNSIIQAMVIERYTIIGNEGIKSTSYDGISESFMEDYSEKIYKQLQAQRKVRFI